MGTDLVFNQMSCSEGFRAANFGETSYNDAQDTALLKQWNLHTQNSGDVKKKDLDDFLPIKMYKDN